MVRDMRLSQIRPVRFNPLRDDPERESRIVRLVQLVGEHRDTSNGQVMPVDEADRDYVQRELPLE